MSRSVEERLRELEADLRGLEVQPAAAVRARGRRRRRRRLAATMTTALVVTGAASTAAVWLHRSDSPVSDGVAGRPVALCVLALPGDPGEVRVRVLDAGARAGLRDSVTAQLRTRRFTVQAGAADPEPAIGATVLRYGPAAIGSATVLEAAVQGPVTMKFDPGRSGQTIDLLLGPGFTRLSSTLELNRNLVRLGEPTAPPQCSNGASHNPGR